MRQVSEGFVLSRYWLRGITSYKHTSVHTEADLNIQKCEDEHNIKKESCPLTTGEHRRPHSHFSCYVQVSNVLKHALVQHDTTCSTCKLCLICFSLVVEIRRDEVLCTICQAARQQETVEEKSESVTTSKKDVEC